MTETIRKTMDNLEKNGIKAFFVETKEEVVPLVKTLVPQGSSVSNGGSVSLAETGVSALLESGIYDFIDRRGLEGEELRNSYIRAFGVMPISVHQMPLPKTESFIMWTAIQTVLPALFSAQGRLLWLLV